MRNLSYQTQRSNAFYYYVNESVGSDHYNRILDRLLHSMETSLGALSPSEKRVIDDFKDWVTQLRDRDTVTNPAANSAFSYFNCNTGRNLVAVAWYGYEDFALREPEMVPRKAEPIRWSALPLVRDGS